MLAIKVGKPPGSFYWYEWHIGEPIPEDLNRVVTFQADGDELNLFLDAMVASAGEHPTVDHTKKRGLFPKQKLELVKDANNA